MEEPGWLFISLEALNVTKEHKKGELAKKLKGSVCGSAAWAKGTPTAPSCLSAGSIDFSPNLQAMSTELIFGTWTPRSPVIEHQLKEHFHYIALSYLIKVYQPYCFDNYTVPVTHTLGWALCILRKIMIRRHLRISLHVAWQREEGLCLGRQVTQEKTTSAQIASKSYAYCEHKALWT